MLKDKQQTGRESLKRNGGSWKKRKLHQSTAKIYLSTWDAISSKKYPSNIKTYIHNENIFHIYESYYKLMPQLKNTVFKLKFTKLKKYYSKRKFTSLLKK